MAVNHWNSITAILKEIYSGETWAVREWKAGRLTELEILMYDTEICQYKRINSSFKDLVYRENPLLKMIKKG